MIPQTRPTSATLGGQLRSIRIIHRVLLGSVLAYIVLAEKLAQTTGTLLPVFLPFFAAVGFGDVMTAYSFRAKFLTSAFEALRRDPNNTEALVRWRKAQMVTMVLLVSVGLLGFALRFLGGGFLAALPFYLTSVVLFLVWRPREIVAKIESPTPDSSTN